MNAVNHTELARVTASEIQAALGYRAARLLKLRVDLKAIVQTGRLSAQELQDLVCCARECAGSDLVEAKASLLDLSVDLDGIVHPGSQQ